MYNIKLVDRFQGSGRKTFSPDKYNLTENVENPDAILVRSSAINDITFGDKLLTIVRIGAGVNTIPVDRCTEAGICVFNCPGGNANAVKELTIAAMIMLMRNGFIASDWLRNIPGTEGEVTKVMEKGKTAYNGPEIMGKSIGILGLGAVGGRVAQACDDLGMKVYGFDPFLSHSRQQELKQYVEFCDSPEAMYPLCDIVSVHAPLDAATRGFVNRDAMKLMKDGTYLINYARGPIVDPDSVCEALESGKLAGYATDFPTAKQMTYKNVLFTPHLGACTPEADENCSVMGARQAIDYIENGNITNSVNLPDVSFARADGARITIIHENKVGMLGLMTEKISTAGLNIENLVNKAKGSIAYTILDFNTDVPSDVVAALEKIDGVIRVRVIPQ